MPDYPAPAVPVDHVEPVPRRIRAVAGGEVVLDTTRALYLWEVPYYPQYAIPIDDVAPEFVVAGRAVEQLPRGLARGVALRVDGRERSGAGWWYTESSVDRLAGHVRFDWTALDAWYEEDEQVFVHPRNPYVRVDALRSTRHVRIELDGVLLAQSHSPVLVFETGLPTRYYLERTALDLEHLHPSDTRSECPYKGRTSAYWSFEAGGRTEPDIAWSYDFPTRQLLPVAGLVAFYNEKVDVVLDGRPLERPVTKFS